MRYAGIIKNDFSAAPGISVTFFTQGCPHRCEGCHNPETWDFEGGEEVTHDTILDVIEAITANGLHRNLCIMGGEPLCSENQFLTNLIINSVKEKLPDTKIYLWTGYCLEDLDLNNNRIKSILEQVDCLIDGPYDKTKRDVSLFMRGSSNQRILYKGTDY
jgi:anaerobic ribonucleoside-triphosphate reductase activating protein